jgi:Uma2 family endonuclease
VNLEHDELQGWLYRLFAEYVEAEKLGQVRGAEYAVRLQKPPRRRLTDLFFISPANAHRLGKTCFDGAPDLVLEVVSPDSQARDYREKFGDYESAGVREYWIINPLAQTVDAHELVRGKYRLIEPKTGVLRSRVLKGFFIRPAWLWHRPFPRLGSALREMGVEI